jgi:hypothetical protein
MRDPFLWLDRLYARSKLAAFAVALTILAVGTIALACLNQDGSSAVHVVTGVVHERT